MASQWFTSVSDLFQRRFGKYLINRYLGTFLEGQEIFADQLSTSTDPDRPSISLHHVALNTKAINAALESSELPVELVDGYIQELSVHVPYSRILTENCFFSIDGLTITLQVRQRDHPSQISASIFHSMCESFSSLDLAEDCLRNADDLARAAEESLAEQSSVPGVQMLAQAIDSIINRVQLKLTNTTIRLEYMPTVEPRGLALEVKIGLLMYSGHQAGEAGDTFGQSTLKRVFLENIALLSDEFALGRRPNSNQPSGSESEGEESDPARSRTASNETKDDPPLKFAEIQGRNEIVVRFADTSIMGLPRSVEAIDLHLGTLLVHMYPHQFHTLIEIISAITVSDPDKNAGAPSSEPARQVRFTTDLESFLHKSMMVDGSGAGAGHEGLWSSETESMASSSEFQSMSGAIGEAHKRSNYPNESIPPPTQSVPVPRIVIKVSNVVAALLEKDELLFKLGGESTKSLALPTMWSAAFNYFNANFSTSTLDQDRLGILAVELTKACRQSHLGVVGYPLVIRYEEGEAMTSASRNKYNMFLSLDVNKLAINENIFKETNSESQLTQTIPILRFIPDRTPNVDQYDVPESDLKFVYRDLKEKKVALHGDALLKHSLVELKLNPCHIDFEPGFSDRIYIFFSYAEFDPDCLMAPPNPSPHSANFVEIHLDTPDLTLDFHVPKVDLRKPQDISHYVDTFWSRKVHPELYQIQLRDFCLVIGSTVPPKMQPLDVTLSCNRVDVRFQSSPDDALIPLIQIKRPSEHSSGVSIPKPAAYIHVSVCLDNELKLQGKYSSEAHKRPGRPSDQEDNDQFVSGSYKVSDSGHVTGGNDTTSNIFQKQKQFIEEALLLGQSRHNILVELKLDDISLILPSKRTYELIYNRLGNEMILWQPEVFKIKEFLYNQPPSDPLQNPDLGFSTCFSGTKAPLDWQNTRHESEDRRPYVSFPRDNSTALEIHMDVCVLLSVTKAQAVITSPNLDPEDEADAQDRDDLILLASVERFQLTAVTGLEKNPQIVLLGLSIGDGCIKFGTIKHNPDLNQIHFNRSPSQTMDVLLRKTLFSERAWCESVDGSRILKMTAKILFDAEANLKTINLAFDFMELSVIVRSVMDTPRCFNWLGDFFTVVEFPVEGYLPPAILTEMQFDIRQSSLELIPKIHPARLALTLGKARVACNLLDTGHDVNIGINLEDVCLFMAKDSVDPVGNSVCIADFDYLDLEVHLKEEESLDESGEVKLSPYLDVSAACNMVRIRTCSDTIHILIDLMTTLLKEKSSNTKKTPSQRSSREGSSTPVKFEGDENVVPDIAEAMEEILAAEKEREDRVKAGKEQLRSDQAGAGAQVFFFPNEGQGRKSPSMTGDPTPHTSPSSTGAPPVKFTKNSEAVVLPDNLGMSESFYQQQPAKHDSSDDSFEEFCVLDHEIGSGIMPKNGEPSPRNLDDDGVVGKENYYNAPQKAIDYLKSPKGFPKFTSRFTVKKLSLIWQIFGGHDFNSDKGLSVDTKSNVVKDPRQEGISSGRRAKKSVLSSTANPARRHEENLKIKGGPGRDWDKCLELAVLKVQFLHEMYPEECREVSRQVLVIPILEIRDKMAASHINKLLHLYSSRSRPRQTNSNMMSIRMVHIQPDPNDPTVESNINVFVQPIRLNIDQDTLFFIIDFFTTLAHEGKKNPIPSQSTVVQYNAGVEVLEVREVAQEVFEDAKSTTDSTPDPELSDLEDLTPPGTPMASATNLKSTHRRPREQTDIFVRSFVFAPDLPIRVDYSAKYLDLTQGAMTGLLSGLASLNCSELSLKSVSYEGGILGLEKLFTLLISDWLADIKQNQIPRLLGGVGPMHSLLQLGQGIMDLICMPIEQYQKDGRILRGLQKGANSFTSLTAMSFLDMTNKLLGLIKFAAEMAFDIMSPEGAVIQGKLPHPGFPRRNVTHLSRPADLREGMVNALAVVREGFDETARTLTEAAFADHQRRGVAGALSGVLRQVPATMMRPVIVATAATSNVLEGVQSQVAPDIRREEDEKWRRNDHYAQ